MIHQANYTQRYTCGQHVAGRGRQIATRAGKAISIESGKDFVIKQGIIVMLPGKHGDPYTVLDEQTFIVLEAQEEHLTALQ